MNTCVFFVKLKSEAPFLIHPQLVMLGTVVSHVQINGTLPHMFPLALCSQWQ